MTKSTSRVKAAMAKGEAVDATPFDPTAVAGDTPDKASRRARKPRTKKPSAETPPPEPPDHDLDDPGAGDEDVRELPDPDDLEGLDKLTAAERIVLNFTAALDQNDRDNGRRLIAWFGADLAYVTGLGWLVWRGSHWVRDEADLDVRRLAQRLVDYIKLEELAIAPTEAQQRVLDLAEAAMRKDPAELTSGDRVVMAKAIDVAKSLSGKRSKRRNFAVTSGNAGKTTAMLQQAQSLKAVPIERLDADNMKFNVRNGTLIFRRDLDPERPEGSERKIGALEFRSEQQREHFITKLADVDYDPDAQCPFFLDQFLAKVMPLERHRRYLQVCTAISLLIGGNDEQRMLYHYGTGANGKSAFIELIGRLAGTYRSIASPETVTGDGQRQGQQANPDIARLHNTRLVTIEELPKNVPLREELIKALTGGTKILARFLNKDFFEFTPIFMPVLSGNAKPAINGADYGIWRRLLPVLWGVTIPEEDRIAPSLLAEKLDAERAGILNWLIEGLMLYLGQGLDPFIPPEVREFWQDYREERDNISVFVDLALEPMVGSTAQAGKIYKAYTEWCEVNAQRAASFRSFGDSLSEKGFKKKRGNYVVYLDVMLRPTASKFDPPESGEPPPPQQGDPGWRDVPL